MQTRFLLSVGVIILFSITVRFYARYIFYEYSTLNSTQTSNHNISDRLIAHIVLFIVFMGIINFAQKHVDAFIGPRSRL